MLHAMLAAGEGDYVMWADAKLPVPTVDVQAAVGSLAGRAPPRTLPVSEPSPIWPQTAWGARQSWGSKTPPPAVHSAYGRVHPSRGSPSCHLDNL